MQAYEAGRYRETLWERWSVVGLIAAAPHGVLTAAALVGWAQDVLGSPGEPCAAGLGMMLVAAPWSLAAVEAPAVLGELILLGGAILNTSLFYLWGRVVQSVWPPIR